MQLLKCHRVKMPVVKMPNGKNSTKTAFLFNCLCVISTFGISEHEVPGTLKLDAPGTSRTSECGSFGMC